MRAAYIHEAEFIEERSSQGLLDKEDHLKNNAALFYDDRLLSAYRITADQTIWIITEAARSLTTVLFPDEY